MQRDPFPALRVPPDQTSLFALAGLRLAGRPLRLHSGQAWRLSPHETKNAADVSAASLTANFDLRQRGASSSNPCSIFSWHSMQWRVQGTASRRLALISFPQ